MLEAHCDVFLRVASATLVMMTSFVSANSLGWLVSTCILPQARILQWSNRLPMRGHIRD